MVKVATIIGNSGLQTWLLQRISGLIVGAYFIAILFFWLHYDANFVAWQGFVFSPFGQFCALVTLISLIIHAWIGFWTVSTDYIKNTFVRIFSQMLAIALLTYYGFWGVRILWL